MVTKTNFVLFSVHLTLLNKLTTIILPLSHCGISNAFALGEKSVTSVYLSVIVGVVNPFTPNMLCIRVSASTQWFLPHLLLWFIFPVQYFLLMSLCHRWRSCTFLPVCTLLLCSIHDVLQLNFLLIK